MKDPKHNIIIINGAPESGKDTFVKIMNRYIPIINYSSIDSVKLGSQYFIGNAGQKTEKDRKFWSTVKQAWTEYNDGPFEEIKKKVIDLDNTIGQHILFLHIREPEEIDKVKKYYGERCKTLLIERPEKKDIEWGNESDKNVSKYNYDYVISNSGTLKDLMAMAGQFFLELIDYKEV